MVAATRGRVRQGRRLCGGRRHLHANYISREIDEQRGQDRMDRDDMLMIDKSLELAEGARRQPDRRDADRHGGRPSDRGPGRRRHHRQHRLGGGDDRAERFGRLLRVQGRRVDADQVPVPRAGPPPHPGQRRRPGYIKTSMSGAALTYDKWVAARVRETPLRRLGEPVDIANACLFLSNDESSFVTGEIIFPDGGVTAAWRA
ncbi:MAG: SDR family oxidoreductase [Acidimicrobiales bacterium]